MIERAFERAKKLDKNKDPVRRFAIRQALAILREAHVVDPKLEAEKHPRPKMAKPKSRETTLELNLKTERERQVSRLISLGFHKELGLSEEDYRASIPEFLPQPEEYKGRFDIPLIVETRIPLKRQHELAGVREFINTDKITNLTEVPNKPYTIWTHDANKYRGISVRNVSSSFVKDEVASPQAEATSLFIHYPEIFQNHGVDAAGSRFGSDNAPYLVVFRGGPGVDARLVEGADEGWGALSRGNVINLGS